LASTDVASIKRSFMREPDPKKRFSATVDGDDETAAASASPTTFASSSRGPAEPLTALREFLYAQAMTIG
jgi:hypothetical protein